MLATKNRVQRMVLLLLGTMILITACSRNGPGALQAGKKYLEAGKIEQAITELQFAVQLLPTNAAAWNYLGVAYHQAGLVTNAADAYTRSLRFDRDLLDVRFNLGCLWLEQERWEEAKTEFTAYTLRRSDDVEGWSKLGLAQLRSREFTAAEKSFREATQLEATNAEAWNGLGLVLAQRNRLREAAEAFDTALKLVPQHRAALLNLATVEQRLNDLPEAVKHYREYLALQPRVSDWEAVNAIVQTLEPPPAPPTRSVVTNPPAPIAVVPTNPVPRSSTSNLAAAPRSNAIPATNANVEARPVTPKPTPPVAARPVTNSLATTEAVKLPVETVVKSAPNETPPPVVKKEPASTPPSATTSKGFFSRLNPFRRNTNSTSVTTNRTATVARATNAVPTTNLTMTASAATAGGKSASDDRRAAQFALVQGQQAQRAQKLPEAIRYYRRAISLDPNFFEAHYCLGLVAYETRSYKTAAMAWESALKLRPDSSDARYNYALTLKADGEYKKAVDELEKLLALHPDEARGHLILGILYAEKIPDIPRARKHYNRVLQLDPRNPQASAIRYWLVANPG